MNYDSNESSPLSDRKKSKIHESQPLLLDKKKKKMLLTYCLIFTHIKD